MGTSEPGAAAAFDRGRLRAALALSLLVHMAMVGGWLRHTAAPVEAAPRRVSLSAASSLAAAEAPRPELAEAQTERPALESPRDPRRFAEPTLAPGPDLAPSVLPPQPMPPLTNLDVLPPAASVLVSIRAVRPPAPVVELPAVVLASDVPVTAPPNPAPPAPVAAPAPESAAVVAPEPFATNRPPRYPTLSRRQGEQGEVIVRALVGEDGRVLEASVARSSGHTRLDDAALAAVRGWSFTPATRAGRPVVHPLEVPVLFELQE